MTAFLVKRLLIMVPTFVGVSLVIWLVMSLAPGEPEGTNTGSVLGGDAGAGELEGDVPLNGHRVVG